MFRRKMTSNVVLFQHSKHTALLPTFVKKYFEIQSLLNARHSLSTLRFLGNSMVNKT